MSLMGERPDESYSEITSGKFSRSGCKIRGISIKSLFSANEMQITVNGSTQILEIT
jgi:hypothetical protein